MRRSIVRAAFDAKRYRLFNPYNRILGQEPDLWRRMVQARAHSIHINPGILLLALDLCAPTHTVDLEP